MYQNESGESVLVELNHLNMFLSRRSVKIFKTEIAEFTPGQYDLREAGVKEVPHPVADFEVVVTELM
ncbi:hypothetical protein HHI36_014751, partial [Cryptolaemus montrouzieri]